MKSLGRQMIPGCLYMVADTNQQHKSSSTKTTTTTTIMETKSSRRENRSIVRLIRWDGKVEFYDRPIKASELMNQYPEYLVCHSESFHIGKKVPTLSEDDQLQMGQSYFLLPTHFFRSVLSFVSISASFSNKNRNNNDIMVGGGKAALLKIFDICRTPSGALQIRLSDDIIEKLINRGKKDGVGSNDDCFEVRLKLCTTAGLEEEYKKLVKFNKSQQWKPKLDSVIETLEKNTTTTTIATSGLVGKIKERWRKKKNNNKKCRNSNI